MICIFQKGGKGKDDLKEIQLVSPFILAIMTHFSKQADEYLDEINQSGRKIQVYFPKVWALIQEWANQEIHPGAIAEVLNSTVPYFENCTIKNPWGYLRGVMIIKSQNWREKDFIKDHQAREKFLKDIVGMMKKIQRDGYDNSIRG